MGKKALNLDLMVIYDAALKEYIKAATGEQIDELKKLATLIGSDADQSVRTIAANEVAKIVAGADAMYDTLKEIADWIMSDATGAAKMANDIKYLLECVDGKDGQPGLLSRVSDLESKFTGDGSVDTKIANAKSEAISTAANDATTKVNGLKNTNILASSDGVTADDQVNINRDSVVVRITGTVGAPQVSVDIDYANDTDMKKIAYPAKYGVYYGGNLGGPDGPLVPEG